jgi:hypothetical protein
MSGTNVDLGPVRVDTRIIVWGTAMLMVVVTFIPPVPREVGLWEVAYVLLFAVILITGFFAALSGPMRIPRNAIVPPILFFYAMMVAWAPISTFNEVTWGEWLRELIPYLNFLLLPLLLFAIRRPGDFHILLGGAVVGSVSYTLQILFKLDVAAASFAAGRPGMLRASLTDNAFQAVPIIMVGFCLGVLSAPDARRRLAWLALLGVTILGVLLTFARGPLVFTLALGSIALLRLFSRPVHSPVMMRRVAIGTAVVMLFAGAAGGVIPIPNKVERTFALGATFYKQRFDRVITGNDSGRGLENRAVVRAVGKSIVFGKGPGFDVSFYHVNRAAWVTRSYTHNVMTYAYLHFGLFGVVALFWLLGGIAFEAWRSYPGRGGGANWLWSGIVFGLAAAFFYVSIQSTFRHNSLVLIATIFSSILIMLPRLGGTASAAFATKRSEATP